MGTTVVIGVLIVAMLVLMFTGTRKQKKMMAQRYEMPVSYTHLTLPTT